MSIKGIDVSSYQGNIDWKKVKKDGYSFAILKIIRKNLMADTKFEKNWEGCKEADVTVQGVYNYSYATSVSKATGDAKAVLSILNGRKVMVWLDVEDNCQKGLGRKLIDIINTYASVIIGAGLPFGVYTGQSFYNSYIKPYGGVSYPLWIARYGLNNGSYNVKYQPQIPNMIGWQYTSKGKVNGISGNVDLNMWYAEIEPLKNATILQKVHTNPYAEPKRLLKLTKPIYQRGNDVKWLQTELIRHGCLNEVNSKGKTNVDGILGNDTYTGIKKFQKKAGITIDGICGAVTREFLKL